MPLLTLADLLSIGDLTQKQLLGYVMKTQSIDESGDASFDMFIRDTNPSDTMMSWGQTMINYLVWANGPEWKDFLDKAEVGDYPTIETWTIRDLDDYWEVTCDRAVNPIERSRVEGKILADLQKSDPTLTHVNFDWRDDQTIEVIPAP